MKHSDLDVESTAARGKESKVAWAKSRCTHGSLSSDSWRRKYLSGPICAGEDQYEPSDKAVSWENISVNLRRRFIKFS